ncbi:MAG: FecR family protein [Parcubacteria group bacterium]|jgi:hypothetical protein
MLDFYEEKGRKIFIIIMIVFILLFTLAFFAGRFYALWYMPQGTSTQIISEIPAEQPTKKINGQVEYAEGTVEVRESATSGWFTAAKGNIFAKGNELRTLGKSRAIVTFEDGSIVRLDENTHIVFVDNVQDIKIDVEQGEIFNSVAKNDARTYIVQTDRYAIKALGTEFGVTESGDTTSVLVVESAVEVQNDAGNTLDRIEEGNKAKVVNDHVEKTVIADADLTDDFIVWSTAKNEDGEKTDGDNVKKDADNDTVTGSITLSGEKSSSGVRLHWGTKGVSAPHGFKIVKSTDANPVYPGDDYQYLTDSSVREYMWEITTGKKYHFRVCIYDGSGKCLQYSNDIYVDTPSGKDDGDGEYASSVSLSAKEDNGDVKLTWEISGGDAPLRFKVVKSKDPNPVYPGDDYQYLSNRDVRKYTWEGFPKGKTYHFRVCIYKGGKCGTYSNDVKVSF